MKNNKRGFSLVEIIVAITILALVSVGILGGFRFSQNLTLTNALRDEKAAILQEAAELLIIEGNLATSPGDFINRAGNYDYLHVPAGDFDPDEDRVQFSAVLDYQASDLAKITSVLYFDGPRGREKLELIFFAFPERIKGAIPNE